MRLQRTAARGRQCSHEITARGHEQCLLAPPSGEGLQAEEDLGLRQHTVLRSLTSNSAISAHLPHRGEAGGLVPPRFGGGAGLRDRHPVLFCKPPGTSASFVHRLRPSLARCRLRPVGTPGLTPRPCPSPPAVNSATTPSSRWTGASARHAAACCAERACAAGGVRCCRASGVGSAVRGAGKPDQRAASRDTASSGMFSSSCSRIGRTRAEPSYAA
jgi:hypothetical protein